MFAAAFRFLRRLAAAVKDFNPLDRYLRVAAAAIGRHQRPL
jgi:hypothetical protein